jgi:hypothetical protein
MEIPPMTFQELNALFELAKTYAADLPRDGANDHCAYHSEFQQNQRFWDGIVEKLEKSV